MLSTIFKVPYYEFYLYVSFLFPFIAEFNDLLHFSFSYCFYFVFHFLAILLADLTFPHFMSSWFSLISENFLLHFRDLTKRLPPLNFDFTLTPQG